MWEPEGQVITALLKAYCAIDEADDTERAKIGKLLTDGYGIDLVLLERRSATRLKPATQSIKSTQPATVDPEESKVEKVKDKTDAGTRELSFTDETKRRNKIEIVETVLRLRTEYHVDIPRQIAAGVSDAERKLLNARLVNIRNLLQHGYRVGLNEDESSTESILGSKTPIKARVMPDSPTVIPFRTWKG